MKILYTGALIANDVQPQAKLSLGGYVSSTSVASQQLNNLFAEKSENVEHVLICLLNDSLDQMITDIEVDIKNVNDADIVIDGASVLPNQDECGNKVFEKLVNNRQSPQYVSRWIRLGSNYSMVELIEGNYILPTTTDIKIVVEGITYDLFLDAIPTSHAHFISLLNTSINTYLSDVLFSQIIEVSTLVSMENDRSVTRTSKLRINTNKDTLGDIEILQDVIQLFQQTLTISSVRSMTLPNPLLPGECIGVWLRRRIVTTTLDSAKDRLLIQFLDNDQIYDNNGQFTMDVQWEETLIP